MRVLVTKAGYSWNRACSYNKGSLAVLTSLVRLLKRLSPDLELVTLIQLPAGIATRHGLRVISAPTSVPLFYALLGVFNIVRAWVWRTFLVAGVDLTLLRGGIIGEFLSSDCIVDVSLDAYGDTYGFRSMWEISNELMLAQVLRRPVIVCAQSVGPFRSWPTRMLAKRVLRGVNLITVREEISLQNIQDLGLQLPQVRLTADLAFLLDPVDSERVRSIVGEIEEKGNPIVGIAISKMKEMKSTLPGKMLGYGFSLLSYILPNRVARLVATRMMTLLPQGREFRWLCGTIEHVVSKYNATVVLVPHIIGSSPDDRTSILRIMGMLPQDVRGRVVAIQDDLEPGELKCIIGKCDCFVGAKMHANIAALSQGVPTLGLSYHHKFRGIMASLGQSSFVLDGTDPAEVCQAFDRLWEDRLTVRKKLNAILPEIRKAAEMNGQLILDIMMRARQVTSGGTRDRRQGRPEGPVAS